MKEGDLEDSLVSVLGNAGGKDLLLEAGELALDSLLTEGVIQEAPVVGTVAKLYSMAIGAQGYIFAKKVKRFLCELGKIPKKEREEFAKKLESDKEAASQTAEVLICMIDKLEDLEKPELLARAFSGYVYGDYDLTTFRRLAFAVDRCLVADLSILPRIAKPKQIDGYVGGSLASAGLAQLASIPQVKTENWKPMYEITPLGRLFDTVVVKGFRHGEIKGPTT